MIDSFHITNVNVDRNANGCHLAVMSPGDIR